MNAKDFLGNELKVGDHVVFAQLGYRNFRKGTIRRITLCCVFVLHDAPKDPAPGYIRSAETKQFHNQVIKI